MLAATLQMQAALRNGIAAMLISSEGAKELKVHADRRARIKALLAEYPEPSIEIGSHVTPDLAELLILLREHALATV